jgi:hypothetical protein
MKEKDAELLYEVKEDEERWMIVIKCK